MRTDLAAHLGPIKWPLAPLWSTAPRIDHKNLGMVETNLLSLSYGRVIRKNIDAIGGLRPESYETYNIIEKGDVVLRMTDLQNDQRSIRVGQAVERGLITSAYITVRPNSSKTDPRFVAAVLRAYDIQKAYYEMGAGVRQNLGYPELADLPIPVPPLATQQRIADYLDRETGEIDSMIATMDELAGQLEARKAVTHEVALAKVESRRGLRWMAKSISTGPFGTQVKESEYVQGGIPLINPSHIVNGRIRPGEAVRVSEEKAAELSRFNLYDGDIVVARRGEFGRCAIVRVTDLPALCGTGSLWVKLDEKVALPEFVQIALSSSETKRALEQSSVGATMNNLNERILGEVTLPCPPLDEQKRIANHLDEVTGKIDAMLAKVAELKSLLTERRAALITDVVTGRKEVA